MTATEADRRTVWISEIESQVVALDQAISTAVQSTETPTLDRLLVRLSDAANNSLLWFATAGVVALVGGSRGRRAAVESVASIALASAVSNLALKGVAPHRPRPESSEGTVLASRKVRRPTSSSFPSGHAASAVAFASTMGEEVPVTWLPLHVAASLVGYARIHTGVHYPSDVVSGAVVGAMCGWTVRRVAAHLAARTGTAGAGHGAAG